MVGAVLLLRSNRETPVDVQSTDSEQSEIAAAEHSLIAEPEQVAGDSLAAPGTADRTLQEVAANQSTKEPQRTLTGRVVFPPGTPSMEEVRVAVTKFGDQTPEFVSVGPDGSFTYPIPSKPKSVYLDLEAQYLYLRHKERVDLRSLDEPVVLEPLLGGRIIGSVRGPANRRTDKPIVGMEVYVGTPVPGETMEFVNREALVDENLEFVLPALPAGKGQASIRCDPLLVEDGGTLGILSAQVYPGRDTTLVVKLVEGAFISGTIDPKLCAEEHDEMNVLVLACPSIEDDEHSMAEFGFVRTSDGCSFSVGPLVSGDYSLRVSWPDKLPLEIPVPGLRLGEDRDVGMLTPQDGASISGTVVYSDLSPASDAYIFVHDPTVPPRPGRFSMFESDTLHEVHEDLTTTRANEQGEFQLGGIGAGPLTVVAIGKKTRVECARLEGVKVSHVPMSITLRQPSMLTVQVTDQAGAGLGNVYVDARPLDRAFHAAATLHLSSEETMTAGMLVLGGPKDHKKLLFPGSWKVNVTCDGYQTWSESVEAKGQPIQLTVQLEPESR